MLVRDASEQSLEDFFYIKRELPAHSLMRRHGGKSQGNESVGRMVSSRG